MINPAYSIIIPPVAEQQKKVSKVSPYNTMTALKTLVKEICKNPNKMYFFNEICSKYNVNRRAFYDFISIGSVFSICARKTNKTFEWYGLHQARKALAAIEETINRECKGNDIISYFNCSVDSSIQNIALNVVKLFYYLGLKILDLRQVAKLFSQGKIKYKTILRKLYTVAACLELAEIIGKTNKVAEIEFLYDLSSKTKIDPKNIFTMLNTKDEREQEIVLEARRKAYNELTIDKRYTYTQDFVPQNELISQIVIHPELCY